MSRHKSSKDLISELYTPITINIKESVTADDLNKNINDVLTRKIKAKFGNKCCRYGYADRDSINILERSIGRINSAHFTGDVIYDIKIELQVCNPKEGDILVGKVIGKNKMGILAEAPPIIMALSKLHHVDHTIFNSITKDHPIRIEVIDSKFELNDTEIHVIGKLYVQ